MARTVPGELSPAQKRAKDGANYRRKRTRHASRGNAWERMLASPQLRPPTAHKKAKPDGESGLATGGMANRWDRANQEEQRRASRGTETPARSGVQPATLDQLAQGRLGQPVVVIRSARITLIDGTYDTLQKEAAERHNRHTRTSFPSSPGAEARPRFWRDCDLRRHSLRRLSQTLGPC